MASFNERKLAIQKLRAERPPEFAQFAARYPDWETWTRGPYGAQRDAVELMLLEYGALKRGQIGGNTRRKSHRIVSYGIKIPLESNLTLLGAEFSKIFRGTYYLFRRPGRFFGAPNVGKESLIVSRVDIFDRRPLNYTETRQNTGNAISFKQEGVAYLAEGSLVFLSSDELGHPWITSYARVNPQNIPDITPILDGHLLGATFEPTLNGNFVVKVMLVRAPNGHEAMTGHYRTDEAARAEFQKLRPDGWDIEWWNDAFQERFDVNQSTRFDGDYFQKFPTHNIEV